MYLTRMGIILIILSLLCLSFAEETVKYAAVIYRHGDRTPVNTFPTDPWRNESLWPVKFGELTNTGKRQHYALGQWLRKRYSHLLSNEFEASEIYIRSTDVDRTLMSAQANLAGMYPPVGKTIWDADLMWQPIPVHTMPENDDAVLAMKKKCPAYDKEMERLVHSKQYIDRLSKYQGLMDYLTAYTGKKIKDYNDMIDVYSVLYIETLYNFTLPNWTQSVYPNILKKPACYSFSTSAATPLLARLRAGPLLKQILSKMSKSMSGTDQTSKALKMSIYSGHDYTVGTVLTAMGLFDGNCPEYTSTIIMELTYDNATQSHSIRVFYRNSTEIVEPHALSIPYCGVKCPVERFIQLYENLLTVNFDHECQVQYPALLRISLFMGLSIFAIICISSKIFYKIHKERSRRINFSYSRIDIDPICSGKSAFI